MHQGGTFVARNDEMMVQLATRLPKTLHRRVRIHCVKTETTLMSFVIQALSEKLKRGADDRRTGTGR
jgi:predicted HicB family RNase H-like nuclease